MNTMTKINPLTMTLSRSRLPFSFCPQGIALSPDGDMEYVSNLDRRDISVINVTAGQVITTFPSGG
jgi:DNA-binding beta-propeller fold protein YncE